MTPTPLNILCQSPVSEGMTAREAVAHTVELARDAEALGYHRFWVAEHHSDAALASGAPEVMVAAIAAQTERLRVGSGGVLLPYYKPFKVAEQFNLLEALFPGRIDLGLGRSGGSERHAAQALGLAHAGVDLLPTPSGYLVLEINGSPGLEGIEAATGRDLAGEVVDWALRALSAGATSSASPRSARSRSPSPPTRRP